MDRLREIADQVKIALRTLPGSMKVRDNLVGKLLQGKSYLENTVKFSGQQSPMAQGTMMSNLEIFQAPFLGGFTCRFTEKDKRDRHSYESIADLQGEIDAILADFPGASVRFLYSQGGGSTDDPVQIEVDRRIGCSRACGFNFQR